MKKLIRFLVPFVIMGVLAGVCCSAEEEEKTPIQVKVKPFTYRPAQEFLAPVGADDKSNDSGELAFDESKKEKGSKSRSPAGKDGTYTALPADPIRQTTDARDKEYSKSRSPAGKDGTYTAHPTADDHSQRTLQKDRSKSKSRAGIDGTYTAHPTAESERSTTSPRVVDRSQQREQVIEKKSKGRARSRATERSSRGR